MRIEVISKREELCKIQKRWKSIVSGMAAYAGPYCSFEWYATALDILEESARPFVICVMDGEEIVGIAPFIVREEQMAKMKMRTISFINPDYTPCQDVYVVDGRRDVLENLVDFLMDTKFRVVDLRELRIESAFLSEMRKRMVKKGYRVALEHRSNNQRIEISGNFDETLNRLDSRTRKEFRRKVKRIARIGELRVDLFKGYTDVSAHLNKFFELYEKTWKGKEPKPQFYYRLAEKLCEQDMLYLHCLSINNKPVGYLYSIVDGDTLYGIKTTYDPSYFAFSPGVMLFYKVIESLHEEGKIRMFEFGRGEEQFKREWNPTAIKQYRFIAYPKLSRYFLYYMARAKLWPKIRSNEIVAALWNFVGEKGPLLWVKTVLFSEKRIYFYILTSGREAKIETEGEFYGVRIAKQRDLEILAVAMSCRNLKDINDRFNRQDLCVVSEKKSSIDRFCWMTSKIEVILRQEGINVNATPEFRGDWDCFVYEHNFETHESVQKFLCEATSKIEALMNCKMALMERGSSEAHLQVGGLKVGACLRQFSFLGLKKLVITNG